MAALTEEQRILAARMFVAGMETQRYGHHGIEIAQSFIGGLQEFNGVYDPDEIGACIDALTNAIVESVDYQQAYEAALEAEANVMRDAQQ